MTNENDRGLSTFWQVTLFILALVAVVAAGAACVYAADITISTTPPKPIVAPAPTATPSALYVILTEQAKASAKVQVITAETDNEIRLRWNIHFMRRWWAYYAIPVGFIVIGLGVGYWGLRYGRE